MTTATMASDVLVQEITIVAPAERVFRALTRAEELVRWWTLEGKVRTLAAECDVRPGGAWWMQVEGPCSSVGPVHKVYGIYRRVEPPRLLEFTWNWEGEDHPESVVRWDLEEKDGITRARVTHSGLTSEDMRQRNRGWSMIVRLLETWVERNSEIGNREQGTGHGYWLGLARRLALMRTSTGSGRSSQ